MLILNGHNSHVTLEVVKILMESELDFMSLPFHTSYALQLLNVSFKSFKTAFRKIRNRWSLRSKTKPVEKQTLCEWTSQAPKAALTPKNIISGFRATGIWPLDHKAASHAIKSSEGYEQMDAAVRGMVTSIAGNGEAEVIGSGGHPVLDAEPVTGYSSHSSYDL